MNTFFVMGAVLCGVSILLFSMADTCKGALIRLAAVALGALMMWVTL